MFFKNVCTIFKREFKAYFYTPLAYVFIGMFVFFMGIMFNSFLQNYMNYMQESMYQTSAQITIDRLAEAFYANMHVILMIMIPFFTMRLFTSESSQGTFSLLMTSPIRTVEIVVAKFAGAATIVLIMLAMTVIFPIFLFAFSDKTGPSPGPDMGVVGATYLGLVLISFTYVAIGTFWSSVTESQLIALVFTFFNIFFLWLLSLWAQSTQGGVQATLQQMAVNEQFQSFARGTLELKSFVIFLSYIFFYLFLTNRSIESRAWRS
ncbi:MAG: ABC transporter permease [Bdellovibrionota bacterium]